MPYPFKYSCGVAVSVGDVVRVAAQTGFIEKVILPGTSDATDFHCQETGGLLIHFDNGDRQLWIDTNEDLEYLHRAQAQS